MIGIFGSIVVIIAIVWCIHGEIDTEDYSPPNHRGSRRFAICGPISRRNRKIFPAPERENSHDSGYASASSSPMETASDSSDTSRGAALISLLHSVMESSIQDPALAIPNSPADEEMGRREGMASSDIKMQPSSSLPKLDRKGKGRSNSAVARAAKWYFRDGGFEEGLGEDFLRLRDL